MINKYQSLYLIALAVISLAPQLSFGEVPKILPCNKNQLNIPIELQGAYKMVSHGYADGTGKGYTFLVTLSNKGITEIQDIASNIGISGNNGEYQKRCYKQKLITLEDSKVLLRVELNNRSGTDVNLTVKFNMIFQPNASGEWNYQSVSHLGLLGGSILSDSQEGSFNRNSSH